jgi:hypothetical protein
MEHVFSIWPTLAHLATELRLPYQTVASWRQRGSIPARYDLEIVRLARARGSDLSLERLAEIRATPSTSDAA